MSKERQFLIETDVLIDHLVEKENKKSSLEKLMESGICFTTVINSAEIYFSIRNEEEKAAVDALMKAVKVLGFHSRYSLDVHKYSNQVDTVRDALICATASINKLMIVTNNTKKFSKVDIPVIEPIKI